MKTITQPNDSAIQTLLTTAATMLEAATSQRINAVSVAYSNGWTYERIADTIGRSYPATRALAIKGDK